MESLTSQCNDEQQAASRLLVERCRNGDKEALGQFYRLHRAAVARNLGRILGPGNGALDDVLQEVFIEAFRAIKRFRGDAKISTWLYRVAVNVALQHLRKRRHLAEVPDEGHEPHTESTPQNYLESRERIQAVYRILEQIAPKKRMVFILHEIEGREPREIADLLGTPSLTVRTRLHYARKEFFALATKEVAFDGGMP